VSFAAITLCVASQRVFIVVVVVYFVIDSVRKLLDIPSYIHDPSGIRTQDLNVRKATWSLAPARIWELQYQREM